MNPAEVRSIMYVCAANKGRSPALAVFTAYFARAKELGYDLDLSVDSAGTVEQIFDRDGSGNPASRHIIAEMKEMGMTGIEHHRTKLFDPVNHGENSDLILAADVGSADRVIRVYPEGIGKVYTVREFLGLPGPDITDAHDGITKAAPGAYKRMVEECRNLSLLVLDDLKSYRG